jgi:hypothetical protein
MRGQRAAARLGVQLLATVLSVVEPYARQIAEQIM